MRKLLLILMVGVFVPSWLQGAEIRLGVEVEFRTFYFQRQRPNSSFQLREGILFFDTFISENASALLEFVLKKELRSSQLERGYFIWRELPLNTQIKFGQFRIPFGFWDAYTIDRSLIKNSFVGEDENFPQFKLRKLDVGVEVRTSVNHVNLVLAVINGTSLDASIDENNHKDLVVSLGHVGTSFSLHMNTYFGTTQRLKSVMDANIPETRNLYAVGADFIATKGNLTLSGEFVNLKYESLRSVGAYLQFNYDLLEYLFGLRLIGKIEYWNPNTNRAGDDLVQAILGIKQTLVRGMTLQIEYRYHTHQTESHNNGVMLEMELEL